MNQNENGKQRLDDLIKIINDNTKSFYKIGCALREIRDKGLYQKLGLTFEEFCLKYLGISRAYAYRQIAASEVVDNLSPNGDIKINEAQIRPLVKLSSDKQKLAWNYAIDLAKAENRKLTSHDVNNGIQIILQKNRKKSAKPIIPIKKIDRVSKEFQNAYKIFFEEIVKTMINNSTEKKIIKSILKSMIKYVESYE